MWNEHRQGAQRNKIPFFAPLEAHTPVRKNPPINSQHLSRSEPQERHKEPAASPAPLDDAVPPLGESGRLLREVNLRPGPWGMKQSPVAKWGAQAWRFWGKGSRLAEAGKQDVL